MRFEQALSVCKGITVLCDVEQQEGGFFFRNWQPMPEMTECFWLCRRGRLRVLSGIFALQEYAPKDVCRIESCMK